MCKKRVNFRILQARKTLLEDKKYLKCRTTILAKKQQNLKKKKLSTAQRKINKKYKENLES